jgi:hypothetical protein
MGTSVSPWSAEVAGEGGAVFNIMGGWLDAKMVGRCRLNR